MTAPLCSTFLNATSAPDFPADISAFPTDRQLKEEPAEKDLISKQNVDGIDEAQPPIPPGGQDLLQSIRGGAFSELNIIPPLMTSEEKAAKISEMRKTDSYIDTLTKMRDISSRIRKSRARSDVDKPMIAPDIPDDDSGNFQE